MTTDTQPQGNLVRGLLVAALIVPITVVVFAAVGGFIGLPASFGSLFIPYVAAGLYRKGAGVALTRPAWPGYIAVCVAAIVLGAITSFIAVAGYQFTQVNGKGGAFGGAFATTLRTQLTDGGAPIPILFGLAFGTAALVSVIRANRSGVTTAGSTAPATPDGWKVAPTAKGTPADQATSAVPPASVPWASTPTAPPAARRPVPEPNQPSPGVLLNGKPIDPQKR